jgi:hypothetical protein
MGKNSGDGLLTGVAAAAGFIPAMFDVHSRNREIDRMRRREERHDKMKEEDRQRAWDLNNRQMALQGDMYKDRKKFYEDELRRAEEKRLIHKGIDPMSPTAKQEEVKYGKEKAHQNRRRRAVSNDLMELQAQIAATKAKEKAKEVRGNLNPSLWEGMKGNRYLGWKGSDKWGAKANPEQERRNDTIKAVHKALGGIAL